MAIMQAEARFWSKVDRKGPEDCWPWLAGTMSGYGQFWARKEGHNRSARGSVQGLSKFNEIDVATILRLVADGFSHREVARKFNVTHTNVGYIARRKTWTHVTLEATQ